MATAPPTESGTTSAETQHETSGNLKEALLLYEVILFRDSKSWQAYNNRGLILEEMGYDDDALFSYRRAVELNPDSHATLYNIGNYYRRRGRYDEALAYYFRAIQIKPDKTSALGRIVSIYLAIRDYTKALQYAQKAFAVEQDETATANLCMALVSCARKEEALEKCELLIGSKYYRRIKAYIHYFSASYVECLAEMAVCFEEGNMDYALAIKKVYCLVALDRIPEATQWMDVVESIYPVSPFDYTEVVKPNETVPFQN